MFIFTVYYKRTLKEPTEVFENVEFQVPPVAGDWVETGNFGGKVVRRSFEGTMARNTGPVVPSVLYVHGNARVPKF